MDQSQAGKSQQELQLEAINRREGELYFQRQKEIAEHAVAMSRRTLACFLRVCELISPNRLSSVVSKYPGVALDEPAALEELTREMVEAATLMKRAVESGKVNIDDVLGKYLEENKQQAAQIGLANQKIQSLERDLAATRRELEEARNPGRKGKTYNKLPERKMPPATADVQPRMPPEQTSPPDEYAEAVPTHLPSPAQRSPAESRRSTKAEQQENDAVQFTEWKVIHSKWNEKEKVNFSRLIEMVGLGVSVARAEIKTRMFAEFDIPAGTTNHQLDYLVRSGLMYQRPFAYEKNVDSRGGRPPSAMALTPLGEIAYRSITAALPAVPHDIRMLAAHKSKKHTGLVAAITGELLRLGHSAQACLEAVVLTDGRRYDADIRIVNPDGKVCFIEVETYDHINNKELNYKWGASLDANNGHIYLAMQSASEAESAGYSALRFWSAKNHQPNDITVHFTGLDALRSMVSPDEGYFVDPWTLVKTIKVAGQPAPEQ